MRDGCYTLLVLSPRTRSLSFSLSLDASLWSPSVAPLWNPLVAPRTAARLLAAAVELWRLSLGNVPSLPVMSGGQGKDD